MVLSVEYVMMQFVHRLVIGIFDGFEHSEYGLQIAAILERFDAFDIFEDKNFGLLNFDVLKNMEENCASTLFIIKALLFPSRR